jgi:hypothetical protein
MDDAPAAVWGHSLDPGPLSRPFHAAPLWIRSCLLREKKNKLFCCSFFQLLLRSCSCSCSFSGLAPAPSFSFVTHRWFPSVVPAPSFSGAPAPSFSFVTHRWFPSVPSFSSGRLALSLCLFLSRCSRGLRSVQRDKDLWWSFLVVPSRSFLFG